MHLNCSETIKSDSAERLSILLGFHGVVLATLETIFRDKVLLNLRSCLSFLGFKQDEGNSLVRIFAKRSKCGWRKIVNQNNMYTVLFQNYAAYSFGNTWLIWELQVNILNMSFSCRLSF